MMRAIRRAVVSVAVLAVTGAQVQGAVITVPNAFADVPGPTGLNTLLRQTGLPRTYQVQIAASELTIPMGSSITGLQWRLWSGSTFPSLAATWAQYEITLAQAANPIANFSTSFADNMVNPVVVRDGPLTIAANAFPGTSGSLHGWGPLIEFTTPYQYQGGDLILLYSHTGSDIDTFRHLDAINSTHSDYGNLFRGQGANSFGATTATVVNQAFTITQFTFSSPSPVAIPEPTALAIWVIGAAAMAVAVARRRRQQKQIAWSSPVSRRYGD